MEAQFRSSRDTRQFRPTTTFVTITVPVSAYDRATGIAIVTVPRAVVGQVSSPRPWILMARVDSAQATNRTSAETKPSTDLAIRASGEPAFRPFSPAPMRVLNGSKTDGWINVAFDLQLTARLTDPSGSYTFRVSFDFN